MKKTIKNIHICKDDDSTTILARSCSGCQWHQTIAGALLGSMEWKAWYDWASSKQLYDVDETAMIDAMSDEHFKDFIKYTIKNANINN